MPCVKSVREPDAANPHVRFDERGEETERLAPSPRLTSTLPGDRGLADGCPQPSRFKIQPT